MLYNKIKPKSRREARMRRDMVLFVFGVASALYLGFCVRGSEVQMYRREIHELNQRLTRALDRMDVLSREMTREEDLYLVDY